MGVGARFGRRIVSKEKNANQTHVVFANPRDCCSPLKTKVYIVVIWESLHFVMFKMNVQSFTGFQSLLAYWRCCYCGPGQLSVYS